ncbi:MAG: FAD-dependent oxidoreductase [Desulfatitalea sp.]|nr:FAD-dependent oxidoreductase [Desulfatitalea sp.]
MPAEPYDLLVAGIGPAGMTAAMYGQRLGLRTAAFGDIPGGSLYMIERLTNFPGFSEPIAGMELGAKLFQQTQAEGAHLTMTRMGKLRHIQGLFHAVDDNGQAYTAPSAIIATGRVPTRLPFVNAELQGVHFCSVCDGPLYRNKNATLAVVGSDNSAAQHALTLSRIAQKVLLIHRSGKAQMDAAHADMLSRQENVQRIPGTEVVGCEGNGIVEALILKSHSHESEKLSVGGLFLAIGWRPNTHFIDFTIAKTADGYLETDTNLMTSRPGLFAAGDVRDTDLWQVLTACADGARAARCAGGYISAISKG